MLLQAYAKSRQGVASLVKRAFPLTVVVAVVILLCVVLGYGPGDIKRFISSSLSSSSEEHLRDVAVDLMEKTHAVAAHVEPADVAKAGRLITGLRVAMVGTGVGAILAGVGLVWVSDFIHDNIANGFFTSLMGARSAGMPDKPLGELAARLLRKRAR